MINMSFGEVLTPETINYRTGQPQMNGLFCQAIFGPVKDWECACGKYKRFRYASVICDKCGVEVTRSSVRRERMGHISLASPCAHPWFTRIVPSRIALALNMKSTELQKVIYFSSYVVTYVNELLREEYINKIQQERNLRLASSKNDFDLKFDVLSKEYQKSKLKCENEDEITLLKATNETKKDILKEQSKETVERINTTADNALTALKSIQVKDVMNENRYYELSRSFAAVFKANIGAEAIDELLKAINVEETVTELRSQLEVTKGQNKKKIAKRLKLINSFYKTGAKLDWMVLKAVMVLPPELRPMLQLEGGRFAHADLNELYRRLINRNNRLRKLITIGAPEVILRNEKRMLQEAVEALIDNSAKGGRQVMASTGVKRALKSLTDILKGKGGRFRQNLLGKRVDYSGRSVIIVGPTLKLDECGVPKEMALELFTPFLIGRIIELSEKNEIAEEYQAYNVHTARRLVESKASLVYDILEDVIKDKYVLLNRAPTLHRLSFRSFRPILIDGKAITLHPLVCSGFNADFDGDQMAIHVPITSRAQEEARDLMAASKNLVQVSSGELSTTFAQDILFGLFYLTSITKVNENPKTYPNQDDAVLAYEHGIVKINETIKVRITKNDKSEIIETSVGRVIVNKQLPDNVDFVNMELSKKPASKMLKSLFHEIGQDKLAPVLDKMKDLAFKYATKSGLSMSIFDIEVPEEKTEIVDKASQAMNRIEKLYTLGLMNKAERKDLIRQNWEQAGENLDTIIEKRLSTDKSIGLMIKSGARGSISNLSQMAGMRGMSRTSTGKIIELCVTHNYYEGVTSLEYFINTVGGRKSLSDVALKTADAGYLTRRLVDVAQNLNITKEDCGTSNFVTINKEDSLELGLSVLDRSYGRYVSDDIVVDGEVVFEAGNMIDNNSYKKLEKYDIDSVNVRVVTHCQLHKGVCQKCFGMDFSTHQVVKLGSAVGVIAAQSLGEPSTQLTMKSKITGGAASAKKVDITSGLPRVEEIFEARNPKAVGLISPISGIITSLEGSMDNGYTISIVKTDQVLRLPKPKGSTLSINSGDTVLANDALLIKESGEVVIAPFDSQISVGDKFITLTSNTQDSINLTIDAGYQAIVKKGDKVKIGQQLTDGSIALQDVLDLTGFDGLRNYVVKELLSVYTANAISVNEKHIEVIIKQMCSKVQIINPSTSDYVNGDTISHNVAKNLNKALFENNLPLITYRRVVTGISKASLSTDSFLSAASFQETARVLVDAVITGRPDHLTGLKENVILGQLVPVGTGFNPDIFNDDISEVDEVEEELFEE